MFLCENTSLVGEGSPKAVQETVSHRILFTYCRTVYSVSDWNMNSYPTSVRFVDRGRIFVTISILDASGKINQIIEGGASDFW